MGLRTRFSEMTSPYVSVLMINPTEEKALTSDYNAAQSSCAISKSVIVLQQSFIKEII